MVFDGVIFTRYVLILHGIALSNGKKNLYLLGEYCQDSDVHTF